jgi:hypothetical protein
MSWLACSCGRGKVWNAVSAFRETIGDFGTLLYGGHDWVDARLGRRSMELMASEVIPRINKAIGVPAAAE